MATPNQKGRIFMTGAAGHVGSRITQFAIEDGYEVYGLSRSEKSDEKLRSLGAIPVRGDLNTLDVLRQESAHADIVISLADPWVFGSNMDYNEVIRITNAAHDAMAEPLKGTGKPLLVTTGTLAVAPDPNGAETTETSPLDQKPLNDRFLAEQHALMLAHEGVKVCAIRLSPFVYGHAGSGVMMVMQMSAANGEVIYVDEGKARTSTIHVDDAARLYLLAAQRAKAGDLFNATSSTDVTFRQMAEAMGSALQIPVHALSFDDAAAKLGPFFTRFLCAANRASSAKARAELGWKPRELGLLEDIEKGSYAELAKELRTARKD